MLILEKPCIKTGVHGLIGGVSVEALQGVPYKPTLCAQLIKNGCTLGGLNVWVLTFPLLPIFWKEFTLLGFLFQGSAFAQGKGKKFSSRNFS